MLFCPAGQTGPVGGLASIRPGQSLRSFPPLIAAQAASKPPTHFVGPGRTSCGSDATQSPYPGRQNPLMQHKRLRYSRNVMRNGGHG
jgi:hypothetical protein